MAIPLIALMGKPSDSVDQYTAGAMNAANVRKTEAEAAASADARKMAVFQQIGGALKGLETLPPEQQAAGFDRIKSLALRTWGDNPDIAAQIEPLTVANLPDLYSMFTSYDQQMKTAGTMAKDAATVELTGAKTDTQRANTGLVYAKTGDIAIDNNRSDRVAGAQIANYGSMIGDRNVDNAREADKLERTAYGQLPDGQIVDPSTGTATTVPGFVAPPPKAGPTGRKPAELPAALKKTEDQDAAAIDTAANLAADAAEIARQLESGEIDPGAVTCAQSFIARNTGLFSDPNTDAYERLNRFRTRFVNEGLRLNSGPQTEGDAQRALNELQYAKDPRSAAAAIRELEAIMRRNAAAAQKRINDRRSRNGVEPLQFDNAAPTSIYGNGAAAPADGGVIEYDAEGNPL